MFREGMKVTPAVRAAWYRVRSASATTLYAATVLLIVNSLVDRLTDGPELHVVLSRTQSLLTVLVVTAFFSWVIARVAVRIIRGRRRWSWW